MRAINIPVYYIYFEVYKLKWKVLEIFVPTSNTIGGDCKKGLRGLYRSNCPRYCLLVRHVRTDYFVTKGQLLMPQQNKILDGQ